MAKFDNLVDRLVAKMKLSQTPVPGFIVGLSGTDSALAFMVAYRACEQMGIPGRLLGVHYVNAQRRKPTWFEEHMVGWLRDQCPNAEIIVCEPLGGNQDHQRWGDLHMRALNRVDDIGKVLAREPGQNYWVVGTINLTEKLLGNYSLLANSASIQVLQRVYKSDVLSICAALDMPAIAIENARLPDCLCGRDELAAANIEMIDDILRFRVDPHTHTEDLWATMFAYVRDMKEQNDFKMRVPYLI